MVEGEVVRETYVGTSEAARMLGVTISTVQDWFRDGKLGGYVRGRNRRVLTSDVERMARERAGRGK